MIPCTFLSDEDREALITAFGGYYAPYCFVFAIACARGLGMRLVLLKEGDTVLHAGVQDDEGFFRDVRGRLDLSAFVAGFVSGREFSVHDSTEEEMKSISLELNSEPLPEELLQRARIHAESLWPEWEWKDSHLEHVKAFTEELSLLCRKYGIWIREMYPTTPPVLYKSDDGAEKFELEQLVSPNGQWMLRRTFK